MNTYAGRRTLSKEYEITVDDLRKAADLAKINLKDDEMDRYIADLNAIVAYAQKLKEVDVDGVEPMISPLLGMNTPLREDSVKPGLTQQEALKAASQTEAGHFRVPKTLQGN